MTISLPQIHTPYFSLPCTSDAVSSTFSGDRAAQAVRRKVLYSVATPNAGPTGVRTSPKGAASVPLPCGEQEGARGGNPPRLIHISTRPCRFCFRLFHLKRNAKLNSAYRTILCCGFHASIRFKDTYDINFSTRFYLVSGNSCYCYIKVEQDRILGFSVIANSGIQQVNVRPFSGPYPAACNGVSGSITFCVELLYSFNNLFQTILYEVIQSNHGILTKNIQPKTVLILPSSKCSTSRFFSYLLLGLRGVRVAPPPRITERKHLAYGGFHYGR